MKKNFLSLICGLLLTSGVFAQSAEPSKRAQVLTDKMKTELELRDDQVARVHSVNTKMMTAFQAAGGADADGDTRKSIKDTYRADLKEVLDEAQLRKAKKMKTVFKDRRQSRNTTTDSSVGS